MLSCTGQQIIGSRMHPVKAPLATKPLGLLQSVRAARRNLMEIIPELATRQLMVSGRMASVRWHMVMDPQGLQHILRERPDDFQKMDVAKSVLEPAIGDSLFIAEGDSWHWQRRTVAPVFSVRNVRLLAPVMQKAARRAVARILAAGDVADLLVEMTNATFEVISDVTLSGNAAIDRGIVHRAIDDYIASTAKVSLLDMAGVPNWIPRPSRLFRSGAVQALRRIADLAIENRHRSGPSDPPDLLDHLATGQDPRSGRRMSHSELRDNLLTFIVAGHETTALSLAWSLYLLAGHPDIQAQLHNEAVAVYGGRTELDIDDIERLTLTRQVIDESLRLYPPAAILTRKAKEPAMIGGRNIERGDQILIPIYALHRNRILWDDPDSFQPARFADPAAIDRFSYIPFGAGRRMCVGASFAIQEAVTILSTLLRQFRFDLIPGEQPEPVFTLTLRPEPGIRLRVTRIAGE